MKSQCQYIIVLIAGFLLWSCSTDKSGYEKLVSEWIGREIKLPEIMTDVLTGDTLNLSDADFKIITYVDNAECTSCKMNLRSWEIFTESLDSISNAIVDILMIVNTDNTDGIKYIITRDSYYHPIVIDSTDMINSTNHFPKDTQYQSFLLDKTNRVVAVGNPILNNVIGSLYKAIISGESVVSDNYSNLVTIKPHTINLGTLSILEERTKNFRIINNSTDTVVIKKIISSCHCSVATVNCDTILPNSTITGSVKFNGDSIIGESMTYIQIFYEHFNLPSILKLVFKIRPENSNIAKELK